MFKAERQVFELAEGDTEIVPGEGWRAAIQSARGNSMHLRLKFGQLGCALAGAVVVSDEAINVDLDRFKAAAQPPIEQGSFEQMYLHEGFYGTLRALGVRITTNKVPTS